MDKIINNYEILEIKEIISETNTIKTFIFDWEMNEDRTPLPGQFVMIWSFSKVFDEKPMSISMIDKDKNEIGITVKNIGNFTANLHSLSAGDKLGIRGPYGNGFNTENIKDKNILAIGGGVGMAPINCFTNYSKELGGNIDIICASVTKDELLFSNSDNEINDNKLTDKFNKDKATKNIGTVNVFTCTDDGTCGFEGYATHRTTDLLKYKSYDMVVVCGPEIMMKGIFDLLKDKKIPAQYSMERYMKCAMGICGQCCVDKKGWRICVEGPVFSNKDLKEIQEFGKYHRNASGLKEKY
ncbi:Sulfhydrogenase 2 subunit gamma [Candidatus Methanobinarius endosymbioticus]|uniref:Sulfhydrogenase 2 subunit gamma n=1 Tax=Candidatus Methanobinarius endosymbioticus TaxID=2006182 RepID=A0A366M9G3_9EURY|nr:Sulfhydrogenase 2 subunit gamma [Candidatus Methanobinarius endosymbioticus]